MSLITETRFRTSRAAELSKFFDQLASRTSRSTTTISPLSMATTHSSTTFIQASFPLTPVVANIIHTRERSLESSQSMSKRARRVTISTTHPDTTAYHDDDMDIASIISVPRFGKEQEKEFRFKFRHMLHKLYPQDWKATVQEVLEQSKIEYKPLAEKLKEFEATVLNGRKGPIGTKRTLIQPCGTLGPQSRRSRPRSHSTASLVHGTQAAQVTPVEMRRPGAGELRALKKRCVGRRKSFGERIQNTSEAGARSGGGWIYDGQASRVEDRGTLKDRRRARRQSLEEPKNCAVLHGNPGILTTSQTERQAADRKTIGRNRAFTAGHLKMPSLVDSIDGR
ncbi:hypothetical protein BKA70DRAFT_1092564 [Coprinopsis sp. MPI-PUGE-AT-0042]|nr:hypothetical protein BKA70DRAFT_1092564 [Coprinopsis sp. MPI-PUGE-AT-0042]